MKDAAKTRLARVLPNLPAHCRDEVRSLQGQGWECGFFLGVAGQEMILCLAAEKDERCHVVFDQSMAALIDRLADRIDRDDRLL